MKAKTKFFSVITLSLFFLTSAFAENREVIALGEIEKLADGRSVFHVKSVEPLKSNQSTSSSSHEDFGENKASNEWVVNYLWGLNMGKPTGPAVNAGIVIGRGNCDEDDDRWIQPDCSLDHGVLVRGTLGLGGQKLSVGYVRSYARFNYIPITVETYAVVGSIIKTGSDSPLLSDSEEDKTYYGAEFQFQIPVEFWEKINLESPVLLSGATWSLGYFRQLSPDEGEKADNMMSFSFGIGI